MDDRGSEEWQSVLPIPESYSSALGRWEGGQVVRAFSSTYIPFMSRLACDRRTLGIDPMTVPKTCWSTSPL